MSNIIFDKLSTYYLFICVRKLKTFDLIHVLEYHGIYLLLELLTPLGVRNLTQQNINYFCSLKSF